MKLMIHLLTPDLRPALEDLFDTTGPCSRCWSRSVYWRIGSAYRHRPRQKNKATFREVVRRGPPPGLLGFDGDLAVGWCRGTRVPRSPRALLCHGLIACGSLSAWTMCRLVTHLLLCAQGLSPAGCHVRAD
jgi:hypothetical protein